MYYAFTFENAGGDTKLVHLSFESDTKAKNFKDAYNGMSTDSKVIRYNRLIYEMSDFDRAAFKNITFNGSDLENFKVMYQLTNGKKHNVLIPFLDKTSTSKADINGLMAFIQDFSKVNSVVVKYRY